MIFFQIKNAYNFTSTMIFYAIASERGLQISPKLLTYVNSDKETNSDLTDLSYLI